MTGRPATTDQQPMVYGATQPARLVITETVAASRTQGDGPWTTAEAILAALDREGYRIFRPVDESLDVWGDGSPTPDVGAAQGGEGGSAAESEPRVHYEVEMYNDGWSIPIYRAHSVDDARAHEEPAVTSASTRIVRVTREVIQ